MAYAIRKQLIYKYKKKPLTAFAVSGFFVSRL